MGARIRIGTSGWDYDHWSGPFYPDGLPTDERLGRYAERFAAVEVNGTFYGLPARATVRRWCDAVGPDFVFALKASRYITHLRKLREPEETLARFLEVADWFGDRCGPLLFQLPPRWGVDPGRLEAFLAALPAGRRCAFEFRDPSWEDPRVLDLLRDHDAAWCVYDLKGRTNPRETTADLVYVRLHGPRREPYTGSYPPRTLAGWAGALSSWRRAGRDVFCFFDNDEEACAPRDAAALRDMLAGAGGG